jgi:hypothetical protein
MIDLRAALSDHDMVSPLTAVELSVLATEMETALINGECGFSHPDWRYVDGLRALAHALPVAPPALEATTREPMTEKRLMQLEIIANATWNRGLGESSAALKELVAEVRRLRSAEAHSYHGRGDSENGPDDPDCPCRATTLQAACAQAGCGFCRASLAHALPAVPPAPETLK